MPIVLENPRIAYFPVPKVACTSLKLLFYRLRFGKPFTSHNRRGQAVHIHNFSSEFATTGILESDQCNYSSHLKIAVVRDPVQRVLSAYTNRVVNLGELAKDRVDATSLEALGIPASPSLEDFFHNIDAYRIISPSIRHHLEPTTTFLGPSLEYFDRVYRIEELHLLKKEIESLIGQNIEMPNEQRSQNLISWEMVPVDARRRVLEYVFGDYSLLKDYYEPPAYSSLA